MARAAWATASRPEPQSRFTVHPATSTGKPAREEGHAGHVAVVLAHLVGAPGVDVLHLLFGDA
jgi:hypothetical protein